MQNPQEDVKKQDPSASRTVGAQRINGGKDSNTSHGKGLSTSKNKR